MHFLVPRQNIFMQVMCAGTDQVDLSRSSSSEAASRFADAPDQPYDGLEELFLHIPAEAMAIAAEPQLWQDPYLNLTFQVSAAG